MLVISFSIVMVLIRCLFPPHLVSPPSQVTSGISPAPLITMLPSLSTQVIFVPKVPESFEELGPFNQELPVNVQSIKLAFADSYTSDEFLLSRKIPTCTRGIGMPRFSGIDLCI